MPPIESLLSRPLVAVTSAVLRAPRFVLAIALLLAFLSLLTAFRGLGFRTSRLDLLDPASSYNQRWLAYLDEFGDQDDVVVLVEGQEPAAVEQALEAVVQRLAADPGTFSSLLYYPDLSHLRAKALHYLPIEHLRSLEEFLVQIEPILQGDWARLNVLRQLEWARELAMATQIRRAGWDQTQSGDAVYVSADPSIARMFSEDLPSQRETQRILAEANRWTESLAAALLQPDTAYSPWSVWIHGLQQLADGLQSRRLVADHGRMGFVLLRIETDEGDFVRGRTALRRLRQIIEEVRVRHADVVIGVTGMPVLESDEMETSQRDSLRSTLMGLAGVVLVLLAGMGGWRGPVLAAITLLLALAWSLGFTTLAVGHLNILSMSFGAILVGLGIDFGIHFFTRYDQARQTATDKNEALREAAGSVGPGISAGAVTTALAFLTASLTHFRGVAELGIIAGGGILLCLAAAVLVMPALLQVGDGRPAGVRRRFDIPVHRFCQPFLRHSGLSCLLALTVIGIAALGLPHLRYDHNLLNLQPRGLESVETERKLIEGENRSVWFALSIAATPRQLAELKSRFEALDAVSRTEEIASLVPPEDPAKSQIIQRIRARVNRLPNYVPVIPVTPRSEFLGALRYVPSPFGPRLAEQLRDMSDRDYFERVSRFQQLMAYDLLRLLQQIGQLADPAPPQAADVPPELRERYVGRSGRHLLKVYGEGSIWDMDDLQRFVRAVESVDPRITGHPIQTYYASRQMQRSYIHAGIYSLIAVAIVLMLDFRSVRCTLLSMLPLVSGVVLLFGLLGWLGIPLNAANLIVLPLLLGIGVDNGVHVVHDFISQKRGYTIANTTARAILLCSCTTMIGFGSMMFCRHQGLRSLGQVLTLGVASCLVSSLIFLPPLLRLLRSGPRGGAGGAPPDEAAFEPAALEPAAFEPAALEPAAFEPAAFEPAAFEPAASQPQGRVLR